MSHIIYTTEPVSVCVFYTERAQTLTSVETSYRSNRVDVTYIHTYVVIPSNL